MVARAIVQAGISLIPICISSPGPKDWNRPRPFIPAWSLHGGPAGNGSRTGNCPTGAAESEVSGNVIQEYTDDVRRQLYEPLFTSHYDYRLLTRLNSAKNLLEISWVNIEQGSPLTGRSIRDCAIRKRTGATIVGIIHKDIFRPNPEPDYPFAVGDTVAVVGSPPERDLFRRLAGLQSGPT